MHVENSKAAEPGTRRPIHVQLLTKWRPNLTLDELRARAAILFPVAVTNAIGKPGQENPQLSELKQLCWTHFKALGFDCMASCFDEVVPKSEGKLSLSEWSAAEVNLMPWTMRIRCRPFYISYSDAHFEIRHEGPLPGVTETGYRSMWVPLATFATMTPDEFVKSEIGRRLPSTRQMTLF